MPNWCYTDYALVGSEENVEAAYDALENLENTSRKCDEPFSYKGNSNWLGYVVTDILGESYDDIPCRGEFGDLELDGGCDYLSFRTETAWGPCNEVIEKFAEKFNLSVNYRSEEFGMCFFEKRNPDNMFPTKFCYNDENETDYFDSLEGFILTYGERYDIPKGAAIEEVQAIIQEKNDCANLYEFEEV